MARISLSCVVCGAVNEESSVTTARVRSDVRRFMGEEFALWQCSACKSIHSRDEVDLDHYYAHYPLHGTTRSPLLRVAFRGKLKGLEQLGLEKGMRVLDYGCGGGDFVQFMQEHGYPDASGYDAYVSEGPYAVEPSGSYDAVLSQDVIEHVEAPRDHLRRLAELTRPGGLILVGTPNAEVVDMSRPLDTIHMLHQPYHRHVIALSALLTMADELGCEVLKVTRGLCGDHALPGVNARFLLRTLRAQGNVIDDMVEGKIAWKWEMFTPGAIYDFFFGRWHDPGNDVTVTLRAHAKPRAREPQRGAKPSASNMPSNSTLLR